jgi:hypothetical protein
MMMTSDGRIQMTKKENFSIFRDLNRGNRSPENLKLSSAGGDIE